jgi:hypothetical protein
LRGSVLAARRCYRAGFVTDLADGTRRAVGPDLLAAAGSYAVARVPEPDRLQALDWRSGAPLGPAHEVTLIPGVSNVSIDDDGTVAWIEDGVKLLAPGATAATALPLARERDGVLQVAAAGGLVAVRDWSGVEENRLQVSARDGSGRREVDGQHGSYGWAFDGTRLAWVAQPCGQTVIQVWDLSGDPPPPADDRCAHARPSALTLKRRRLTVDLRCPRAPAIGCAGFVTAVLYRGTRRLSSTDTAHYRIEAGRRGTVRLRVPHLKSGRIVARVNGGARLRVQRSEASP